MKTKEEFRRKYRQLRKKLSEEDVHELSLRLTQQVEKWLAWKPEWDHFHLFFPIARFTEVNTFFLKAVLERMDKTLYTSQVIKESLKLETLKLPKDAAFFLDEWGIPVPQESLRTTSEKIEVIFLPLLAYDKAGNRLGFGKGYYDAFLAELERPVVKVGLSFFEPEDRLPVDAHDIPLDFCITPRQIHAF